MGGPLAELNQETETLRSELAAAYDAIRTLRDRVNESGTLQRAQIAEDQVAELEADNQQLAAEVESLRMLASSLEREASEHDRELQDTLHARDEAEQLMSQMRRDLERCNDELQRERQRAAESASAISRATKDRSTTGVELSRAMAENAEMRDELQTMTDDVKVRGVPMYYGASGGVTGLRCVWNCALLLPTALHCVKRRSSGAHTVMSNTINLSHRFAS